MGEEDRQCGSITEKEQSAEGHGGGRCYFCLKEEGKLPQRREMVTNWNNHCFGHSCLEG